MSLLVVILLVIPGTTLAKVPWHSVEFLPAVPIAGEPLTVVVRFWDDGAHTQPSTWWPHPTEFQSAAGRVPLTMRRTGDGTFHAEVTLGEGTWRLVTVLGYAEISGPADVELATVTVAAAPSAPAPTDAAGNALVIVTLALLVGGAILERRRLRRGSVAP